jgi:hypothetical protein
MGSASKSRRARVRRQKTLEHKFQTAACGRALVDGYGSIKIIVQSLIVYNCNLRILGRGLNDMHLKADDIINAAIFRACALLSAAASIARYCALLPDRSLARLPEIDA